MNDPKNWSIEFRLRGDELCTLIEGLETALEKCHFPDPSKAVAIEGLLRKAVAKWEANA